MDLATVQSAAMIVKLQCGQRCPRAVAQAVGGGQGDKPRQSRQDAAPAGAGCHSCTTIAHPRRRLSPPHAPITDEAKDGVPHCHVHGQQVDKVCASPWNTAPSQSLLDLTTALIL